jgi:hypothetical protein
LVRIHPSKYPAPEIRGSKHGKVFLCLQGFKLGAFNHDSFTSVKNTQGVFWLLTPVFLGKYLCQIAEEIIKIGFSDILSKIEILKVRESLKLSVK